jgi:uncharacterized protein YjdB
MTFMHKLSCRLALMRDALLLLASVGAIQSCEVPSANATDPAHPVVQVIVVPESLSLDPAQHMQFAAYGRAASSDSSAVTVSWSATGGTITPAGMFAADTAAGDFLVSGTSAALKLSASSRVHIRPRPVASVSVTPASPSVSVAQAIQLAATVRDANGNMLSGRVVTWASSNSAVATVSGGGLVTAVAAGSATITATSEGKSGTAAITATQTPAPVASVNVSPASPSVTAGQTVQLAATPRDANGNTLSGRVVTWTSSNYAVATVSGSGLVSGVAAGSATITATSEGKSGTSTATVTPAPVPVASVSVSPASVSVTAGQTVQLAATPRDAGGNALAGRVVTWSSSNTAVATVNGSGLVTGVGAGSTMITATSEGKSGTSTVMVTPVPVASVSVSPASASVTTGQTVQLTATPRDASGSALAGRVVTWGSSNTAVATVNGNGLVSGVTVGSATITATSEGKSGTAAVTVTAASGGGTVLFQEAFEDTAFASRGWYDNTSPVTTTAQHTTGSTRALELHYTPGATTPVSGGSARHLFTATPTVYISYWVKYSDNWVGSSRLYHPHEFLIMSDLDGDWDGPSTAWLVAYVEQNYQNGGIPRLQLQDSKAINLSYGTPPINLLGITENRSTCGCNGVVEPNVVTSCFSFPPWYNDKELIASGVSFQPTAGPGYKGNWNHVEAYFAINSIAGGIGQADGMAQYWFNGTLVIDRHDILFRTGARPSINFHQFLIAPYIGDGSPVDQYMWVDDLTVATAKP